MPRARSPSVGTGSVGRTGLRSPAAAAGAGRRSGPFHVDELPDGLDRHHAVLDEPAPAVGPTTLDRGDPRLEQDGFGHRVGFR